MAKHMRILPEARKEDESDWRDVPGYEGRYQCSRFGNVRSIRESNLPRARKSGKMMKIVLKPFFPHKGKHGQRSVVVSLADSNGKQHQIRVSKIVAETWMGGIPEGMCVYHKNWCVTDNAVYNLEFVTREEIGKRSGFLSGSKPVAKVDRDGNVLEYYRSATEAARHNPLSYQSIMNRCNNKLTWKEYEYSIGPDGIEYTFRWDD